MSFNPYRGIFVSAGNIRHILLLPMAIQPKSALYRKIHSRCLTPVLDMLYHVTSRMLLNSVPESIYFFALDALLPRFTAAIHCHIETRTENQN
jgi:hypothetical protein